jgi:hypothetical protein
MKPYIVAAVFGDPTQPHGFLGLGTYAAERPDIASAHVIDQIIRDHHPAPLTGVTTMELSEEMVRGMLALFEQPEPGEAKVIALVPPG